MRNRVTVILRGKYIRDIEPEDIEVCRDGNVAFKKLGKNYHTMKKKWLNGVIDMGYCKIIRKEIERGEY